MKLTDSVVEIYDIHKEDMPDAFNQPEMNDIKLKQRAASIGTHTSEVIERVFKSVSIKERTPFRETIFIVTVLCRLRAVLISK